jgi:hypothetical protein
VKKNSFGLLELEMTDLERFWRKAPLGLLGIKVDILETFSKVQTSRLHVQMSALCPHLYVDKSYFINGNYMTCVHTGTTLVSAKVAPSARTYPYTTCMHECLLNLGRYWPICMDGLWPWEQTRSGYHLLDILIRWFLHKMF